MKTIRIENNFAQVCPGLKIGIIGAQVTNTETDPRLWEQIDDEASRIAAAYKIDEINKRPAIQATRKAYRSFGKDPNRYRVSSEALCRRIIRGLGIYRIDTLVDLINLVSVRSGYSIGASMPIVSKETLSFWESGKKEKSSEVSAGAFSISKDSRFTATIKEV